MARLELIQGRAQPAALTLVGETVLGRASDVEVQLLDETASRRHAVVRDEGGRTVLLDLGSANGTRLNGQRLERPAALFDGDVIEIGSVRLRFRCALGAQLDTAVVPTEGERVEQTLDPERADPGREGADAAAQARLRLVCDVALAVADCARPRDVAAVLLARALETWHPDRAVVALRDASGRLEPTACFPPHAGLPTSRTLLERVVDRGEAVRVRDAHDAGTAGAGASLVLSRHRSTLAAPLVTPEGVLGFVTVEALEPGRYVEADLEALSAAARLAALALRNLRTLTTARSAAQRHNSNSGDVCPPIVGHDPSIEALRAQVSRAAQADANVLILGETGTGKELVARRLHAEGPRAAHPFVALNCAALVEGLLESELFGHERGAFTGAVERHVGRLAQAGEGTLFLDEVGELPLPMQAKLLRVLSERAFTPVGARSPEPMRCRLLAATNRDLAAQAAAGRFREDLYYRLAVVSLTVPPLRERPGDVVLLAEAQLERLAAALSRPVPRLSADAQAALSAWRWPGNVRELVNALERALVLGSGATIELSDLPAQWLGVPEANAPTTPTSSPRPAPEGSPVADVLSLREAEARAVRAAIEHTGGRKGAAAQLLGISWPTLNRKLREFGLEPPEAQV